MTIPAELSALVRVSTATVMAFNRLQQARTDEASPKALKNLEGVLYRALEAQHDALKKIAMIAARPNEPLDLEKIATGLLSGLAKVKAFTEGAKQIGNAPRIGRVSKPIIDIKPEP